MTSAVVDWKGEEWRPIPIEGLEVYEVSNFGRVKRKACIGQKGVFGRQGFSYSEHLIVPTDAQLNLYCKGKSKWFSLAALVLRAFVGPPPDGYRLSRHLDDNRNNNHVSNLAWGDDQLNCLDAVRNGSYRNFKGWNHTKESKAKIGANTTKSLKGRPLSEEHKVNIGKGHWKNRSDSNEISERLGKTMSLVKLGKPMNFSEEVRRMLGDKASRTFKGKKHSPEHNAKLKVAALAREEKKRQAKQGGSNA